MIFRLFILSALLFGACTRGSVTWVSVSPSNTWNEEQLNWETTTTDAALEIDTSRKEQIIDGFGGCLNEMGWQALNHLDSATRESILSDFFAPDEGFNLTICRLPIGANDYALNWYSLNDSAGDFDMTHFSLARDLEGLIPYIKRAQAYQPDLRFWGSPWCPPAWMKHNQHYACAATDFNQLDSTKQGAEGRTQFIMKPEYLHAYARYFSKYITEYSRLGIPIYAVHVQNEFNSCQVFPSCIWRAADLATFIGSYLGPTLAQEHPSAEIWFGTIERPYVANIDTMLSDTLASKYVKGLGFQWAGKDAIAGAHVKYPDIRKMQTESECGDGSNDWKAARHTWGLIRHYLTAGANAYMYWNLALEKNGISYWGWKQNSLVSVDTATNEAVKNPEYWLFRLLTHHVKPGAQRIALAEGANALAFVNPDKSIIVLLENPLTEPGKKAIRIGEKTIQINLQPESFHALIIPSPDR